MLKQSQAFLRHAQVLKLRIVKVIEKSLEKVVSPLLVLVALLGGSGV